MAEDFEISDESEAALDAAWGKLESMELPPASEDEDYGDGDEEEEPTNFAERCGRYCSHRFADSTRSDVAVAGKDGARAAKLLSTAQEAGSKVFSEAAESAVTRLLNQPNPMHASVLFNDDELEKIQSALVKVIAAADLLGRARIRKHAEIAESKAATIAGAGADGTTQFADLPIDPSPATQSGGDPFWQIGEPVPLVHPVKALDYFRKLVPQLGTLVDRYGPRLERHAFTLAVASDSVLLEKVKRAIVDNLAGGANATPKVQKILDDAGVGPKNPQYAEMCVRTNMMDAYNQGAADELATPEMQRMFPVWRYLGILDERTGDDHRPKIDKYYPTTASFHEVRGPRVFNCRCSPQPISKYEWPGLQREGASVETEW